MDGTLINTSQITVQACQQAALEFDIPVPEAQNITGLIGWANCEFFPKLYPEIEGELLEKYAQSLYEKESKNIEKIGREVTFSWGNGAVRDIKAKRILSLYWQHRVGGSVLHHLRIIVNV